MESARRSLSLLSEEKKFFSRVSRSVDTCENNLCSWQEFVIHGSTYPFRDVLVVHHPSECKTLFIVRISRLRVKFQVAIMARCIVSSHLQDRDFLLGEFPISQLPKL